MRAAVILVFDPASPADSACYFFNQRTWANVHSGYGKWTPKKYTPVELVALGLRLSVLTTTAYLPAGIGKLTTRGLAVTLLRSLTSCLVRQHWVLDARIAAVPSNLHSYPFALQDLLRGRGSHSLADFTACDK